MSNIDNGADYGKMYLFLGQLKDDWMKKADANNDGEVTAGEFAWFISESNEWDTDTLGNRPDNDIIHNFFSSMLDINNTSQHYLDQAEMDKVFAQDRNTNGILDWKEYIQKFADSIGLNLGGNLSDKTLDDIKDIADAFENHSYVNWNVNSEGYSLDYNSSGYTISGLIEESKGMTFTATAEGLSNVNFNNGTLTFKAPDLEEAKTYTITITATGKDGSKVPQNITVTIGAKPEENPLDKMTWDKEESFEKNPTSTESFNIATNIPEGTKFKIVEDAALVNLSIDDNGKLTFTPNVTGRFTIEVEATNGKYSKTYTTTITVTPPQQEEVEDTTEWTTEFELTNVAYYSQEGHVYYMNPAKNQPEGTTFKLKENNSGNTISIDSTTGKATLWYDSTKGSSSFEFVMVAKLPNGEEVERKISVSVTIPDEEKPEVEWKSTSFSLNSGDTKEKLATVFSKTGDLNFQAKSDNEKLKVAYFAKTGELTLIASEVNVITPATVTVIATTPDGKEVDTKTFNVTIYPLVEQEDDSNDPPFYIVNPVDPFVPSGPSDTPETPTIPGLKTAEGFDVLL